MLYKKIIPFVFLSLGFGQSLFADGHGAPGIRFIENKGMWPEEVLFKAAVPGGDLYILKNKIRYAFYKQGYHGHQNNKASEGSALRTTGNFSGQSLVHSIELSFEGADAGSRTFGTDFHATKLNYFKGNSVRAAGVRSCSKVIVAGLYPGIDLQIYTSSEGIKYDLLLGEGIDPSLIKIKYSGQDELKIHQKRLVIGTVHGPFFENVPVSFSGSEKREVQTEFRINGNLVSFHFPTGYDKSSKLVIDPELIFSTYSGSYADNWGFTATYDDEGNLYSGGIVYNVGFPTTTGVYQPKHIGEWDVGILKYDPTGRNLLWATYLGGSFSETPQSIMVNHKGQLVIYGTTSSPDFPMTSDSFQKTFLGGDPIYDEDNSIPYRLVGGIAMLNGTDIFLAILSGDGSSLEGATFIGGTENDGVMEKYMPLTKNYGDQFRGEVIVDKEDNIFVASNTGSSDFQIKNGVQSEYGGESNDGVVMKFNPNLSDLLWSTYIGGSGTDALFSVKVDRSGNVFVAGGSTSTDFPVTPGTIKTSKPSAADIDGVVVKLSADGSELLKGTFLGTSSYDQAYFLELDSSDRVYLLGQTQGAYPVTEGVYSDSNSGQFIHKLGNDLDSTYFSTVVGSGSGSPDISPTAFLVNECENIFISGWGGALNHRVNGYIGGNTFGLPITDNAFQKQTDGTDFYLMVLLQDAKQLLYGTYFGEINGRGEHVDGGTSRFDKRGIVYQSVCGGCGGSSGFPTWPPDVWSPTNNSNNCNNAAFKFDLSSLLARFETDTPEFTDRGIRDGCYPLSLVFLNESIGGEDFLWNFGEGTVTNREDSIAITYELPGVYPVVLTATDINTCTRVSRATGKITVYDYGFGIMPNDSICYGESIELEASGGILYRWSPSKSLKNPHTANPVASPDTTTVYSVFIEDINGCKGEDSLQIKVIPKITADFSYKKEYDCFAPPTLVFTNKSENASKFLWDFGDGHTSEAPEPTYRFAESDSLKNFTVTLVSGESFCSESKSETVTTVTPFVPNFISPNHDGRNDFFEITTSDPATLTVYNRWGKKVFHADEYVNNWDGGELEPSVYYYRIIFKDKNTSCKGWLQVVR